MKNILIDEEFKNLIPPLTTDEFNQLEENILKEGIREKILTWNPPPKECSCGSENFILADIDIDKEFPNEKIINWVCNVCRKPHDISNNNGVIIDGHNRFEIAKKHNIDFKFSSMKFNSREDVKIWIIKNQFGRRNLSNYDRSKLALRLEPLISAKAKARQYKGINQYSLCQKSDEPSIDTKKELATIAGVSHDTISKVKVIEQKASPEIKQKLSSGEVSINQAYGEIKKKERAAEIKEERTAIAESAKNIILSDRYNIYNESIETWQNKKQYDYIITDPPYPKEFLNLYEILAERANEFLKDGGLLIAMCGQSYLNQIYKMMSKHLDYYWTACYLTPGQPTPLRQINVNTTWKPLLIFKKKGDKYKGKIFGDVFKSDGNDKDFHKWGQSESGMYDIISKICNEGSHILDPFCGAGTTGVAAIKHNCFFDGVEIEEENCNIIKRRINDQKEK